MPRSQVRRRLITVLFLDIVGSTALAVELGDTRWRVVLTSFRTVVRAQLKRFGGREQSTEGDSFFATFAEPVQALRAAAAIAASVQDLGLDVRSSVHTGEVEEVDGTLGGIAVHIGARVMALAGPAEVMATSTVKDLVAGSGATFEDAGAHELKGVEGLWHAYRLRSVDVALPPPLTPEVAHERLAVVALAPKRRRRVLAAAAIVAVAAAAAAIGILATRGSPPPRGRITLMQIDPGSGKVVQELRDGRLGCPCGANLFSVDGTLWQRAGRDGNVILVRDMRSGGIQHVMDAPIGTVDGAVGFGSIWVLRSLLSMKHGTVTPLNAVQRRDELSSRVLANVRIPGDIQGGTIAAGGGAIWVLQPDGTLDRIDPATNRVTGRYASHAIETTILLPAGPYLWICECVKHEVLRYDPRSRTGKTFHFNEQPWHLVQVTRPGGSTLWLMDEAGATLTRIDPSTGRQLQPLGLNGHPTEAAQLGNSIWVAAGDVVDRIRLPGGVRTSYPLPKGVNATGIASDAATGRIWVLNSFRPPPS